MVLILDAAMLSISGNVNSTLPAASNTSVAYNGITGNVVGTARVRSLEQVGDTPGKSNNKYKFYVSDIIMNSGKSFRNKFSPKLSRKKKKSKLARKTFRDHVF